MLKFIRNNNMGNIQDSPLWNLRHKLFSKFDEGIMYDEIGLHSIKPEKNSVKLGKILKGNIVFDGFCGLGGNAIGFALSGKKVITCDIDENRLNMAKNNAKIYGVDDKIEFIHGSVLDYISIIDYDIAYFDPPWSNSGYYLDKPFFNFSDFSINGIDLINLAKQKTENIIFALPKNFDISEIEKKYKNFILRKEIIDNQFLYYTLFFDCKNEYLNYKNIILSSMDHYLSESFLKADKSKHEIMTNMFNEHMELITDYCYKYYLEKNEINQDFIKGLHKILYPENYKQYIDSEKGKILYMVPGYYKTYSNSGSDFEKGEDFEFIKPEFIKHEMSLLVNNFNNKLDIKKDDIIKFNFDFTYIHPFADGNGRVASILLGIMLQKYRYENIQLNKIKEFNYEGLYKSIRYYDENKSLDKFYDLYSEYIEQSK